MDRQTDGRTNVQTSFDGIVRVMHSIARYKLLIYSSFMYVRVVRMKITKYYEFLKCTKLKYTRCSAIAGEMRGSTCI